MRDNRRIYTGYGTGNGKNAQRRREPDRRTGQRRMLLFMVLPWMLLVVNFVFLLQMRTRMQSVNENLKRVLSRVAILEDMGLTADAGPDSVGITVGTVVKAENTITDYADQVGLQEVEPPKERTHGEILTRLKLLGTDNKLIEKVAENSSAYPEQLLEALANNPELADFAADFLEKKGTVTGEGLTESEKAMDYPLFLQWDPRWGYASYGDDSVVGLSGCGPTALSMVLYYLKGDETLTPDKLAAYSMENGYYISGTGTAWLLMEEVPLLYGVSVSQPEASEWVMKQVLDQGQFIICSVGPGDFTIGGHFVVIYGYDSQGFRINDPNCVARSREHWTWEQLKPQIKNIWVFRNVDSTSLNQQILYYK